ncbi:hypothetical protein ES703_60253 [subsurface metagenome]
MGHDLHRLHRFRFAHHPDLVDLPPLEELRSGQIQRFGGTLDIDAVMLGGGLQPGGGVDHVTHHGVVHAGDGAHVAGNELPGVNTDAHAHIVYQLGPLVPLGGPLLPEFSLGFLHSERSAKGPQGVVFHGHRRAEDADDGVALELVQGAPFVQQDIGHTGEVLIEQRHQLLGGEYL